MTYVENGGALEPDHLAAALYSVYGSMINWIQFNITITDKAGYQTVKKQHTTKLLLLSNASKKSISFFVTWLTCKDHQHNKHHYVDSSNPLKLLDQLHKLQNTRDNANYITQGCSRLFQLGLMAVAHRY